MSPVVAILAVIGIVLIPTVVVVVIRAAAGAATKGVSAAKQNRLKQRQKDLER